MKEQGRGALRMSQISDSRQVSGRVSIFWVQDKLD